MPLMIVIVALSATGGEFTDLTITDAVAGGSELNVPDEGSYARKSNCDPANVTLS